LTPNGALSHNSGDHTGSPTFWEALRILQQDLEGSQPRKVSDLVDQIEAMGFQWGVSDGN